jgi:hypothetical protein
LVLATLVQGVFLPSVEAQPATVKSVTPAQKHKKHRKHHRRRTPTIITTIARRN